MNCDETRHHLYIYLDGEATILRRWRVRRHLRQCPPCEDGFVFEEHLKVRVRQGCREEVPGNSSSAFGRSCKDTPNDGM